MIRSAQAGIERKLISAFGNKLQIVGEEVCFVLDCLDLPYFQTIHFYRCVPILSEAINSEIRLSILTFKKTKIEICFS